MSKYYLTEVDKEPHTVYCRHDLMGERILKAHQHTKGQFLYTEGGIVHIITEEKTYFLPARHYIWIPPNTMHTIRTTSVEATMRNLYFEVRDTDSDFFRHTGIYPVNDLLFEMLLYTHRWTGDISPENNAAAYAFTTALKAILPEISTYSLPLSLPYPTDTRLENIVNYMSHNLEEAIRFSDLAKRFGFSERSLARLFQKDMDMSFVQFFTLQRMLKALEYLLEDKKNVNEVAFLVGYNSVPTFSNTFQKVIGLRPSEYVKLRGVSN